MTDRYLRYTHYIYPLPIDHWIDIIIDIFFNIPMITGTAIFPIDNMYIYIYMCVCIYYPIVYILAT